jgi:hypothetical protein
VISRTAGVSDPGYSSPRYLTNALPMVRSIYRFKTDALSVSDDFAPIVDE